MYAAFFSDIFQRNRFGICIGTIFNIEIRIKIFRLDGIIFNEVRDNICDTDGFIGAVYVFIDYLFAGIGFFVDIIGAFFGIINASCCVTIENIYFPVTVQVNIHTQLIYTGFDAVDLVYLFGNTRIRFGFSSKGR